MSSINDLFNSFFEFRYDFPTSAITTKPKDFKLTLELPGVKREEINITHDGTTLWVKVNSKRKGIRTGSYDLSPLIYDTTKIDAKLEDGILEIFVPLKADQKSSNQVIEIK